MRNDPRYTPSDVFETFPRPLATRELEEIGREMELARREIMERRGLGITPLYNLVNDMQVANATDMDVARMRELHVALDAVVLDAYGWSDIEPDYGFYGIRKMQRWTVSPSARIELLDRLLKENHRRAIQESDGSRTGSPMVEDAVGF